jgi:microcin C transport system substrate-binding protein
MAVLGWGQSESPGNEQRSFWSSSAADSPGSRNYAGIKDPVVDELVEQVISAPDRESLVTRTRALDRVLLWGFYVIPNWYLSVDRILYWDKFSYPEVIPARGTSVSYWWFDPVKAERLKERATDLETAEAQTSDTPGAGTVAAWFAGLMVVGYFVFRRALNRKQT